MMKKLIKRNRKLYKYLMPRYWYIRKHFTRVQIPPQGIHVNLIKDDFKGKRCFIIGGGPSINEMDLSKLNEEHCFAVNRGYLLKDRDLNKVDFYCIADIQASNEYGAMIDSDFADHFIAFAEAHYGDRDIKKLSRLALYGYGSPTKRMKNGYFQYDIEKPLALSRTIVLHALQVAVYLGFKDIYFIGVDNNFTKKSNMHWYKDSRQEKINIIKNIGPFEKDNAKSFAKAYKILKRRGVNIYNAGVGGDLNTIPRVNFDDLFK